MQLADSWYWAWIETITTNPFTQWICLKTHCLYLWIQVNLVFSSFFLYHFFPELRVYFRKCSWIISPYKFTWFSHDRRQGLQSRTIQPSQAQRCRRWVKSLWQLLVVPRWHFSQNRQRPSILLGVCRYVQIRQRFILILANMMCSVYVYIYIIIKYNII